MSVQQGISIHTAPEHLKPALRLLVLYGVGHRVNLPSGGYSEYRGELPANRDAVLVSADELEERGELNKALILRSISKLYRK